MLAVDDAAVSNCDQVTMSPDLEARGDISGHEDLAAEAALAGDDLALAAPAGEPFGTPPAVGGGLRLVGPLAATIGCRRCAGSCLV